VLSKYRKHLQLGNVLQRQGLIDQSTLDWALKVQETRGDSLGSILLKRGVLTEAQLFSAFSLQYNIPFETLEGFEFTPGQKKALAQTVEETFSERFQILPLRLEENTLTVAVSDPADLEAVNSLRARRVDLRTRCVLVTPATRRRLHAELYSPSSTAPARGKPPSSASPNVSQVDISRKPARSPRHEPSEMRPEPDDQDHQEGDTPPVVYQTVFSAPEISRTDIQRLHHAYESLVKKTGQRPNRSPIGIFEAFIRSRHNDIRRRYGCSRVAFCIMHRSNEVILFATPDP